MVIYGHRMDERENDMLGERVNDMVGERVNDMLGEREIMKRNRLNI